MRHRVYRVDWQWDSLRQIPLGKPLTTNMHPEAKWVMDRIPPNDQMIIKGTCTR